MQNIQQTYLVYCGVDIFTGKVKARTGTVMDAMDKYLRLAQAGYNYSTNSQMRTYYKKVNDWATETTELQTTFFDLVNLNTALVKEQPGQGSVLQLCANSIFTSWQTFSGQKSPVDDRQYYGIIYGWVLSLIDLQTQAMQMLQAAHLYK